MALVFLTMCVSISLNYYWAYRQLQVNYEKELQCSTELWFHQLDDNLSSVRGHIHELGALVSDKAAPRNIDVQMPPDVVRQCVDMMKNKTSICMVMTAMFVKDEANGTMLFIAADRLTGKQTAHILALKQFLSENELPCQSLNSNLWTVEDINGEVYFLRAIRLGKYVVGALSPLADYTVDKFLPPRENSYVLMLDTRERVLDVVGKAWGRDAAAVTESGIQWKPGSENRGRNLAVSVQEIPHVNGMAALAAPQESWNAALPMSSMLIMGTGLVCILLLLLLSLITRRLISRPINAMMTGVQAVSDGNLDCRVPENHWGSQEFNALTSNFNQMVSQVQRLRIEAYEQSLQRQHDELIMLRAQIQPHTFLNALNTVSNMTYKQDGAVIRRYLMELSKNIRYMLSTNKKIVFLRDELGQVNSFLEMQNITFPGSVHCETTCPPELTETRIPYLLLYTVVGNTIKHAMDLYNTLEVKIICQPYEKDGLRACRITVQDNGRGFPPETLRAFAPGGEIPEAKTHLGLTNARRTLELLYARNDLLRLRNLESGGACVELLIPQEKEERHEVADL